MTDSTYTYPAILIDSCVSWKYFREHGPDVEPKLDFLHVREIWSKENSNGDLKAYDPGDEIIQRYAHITNRIVVTRDSDFKTLVMHHQKPNQGIIWLKGLNSPADIFHKTIELLDKYGEQVKEGRLLICDRDDNVELIDTPYLLEKQKKAAPKQKMARRSKIRPTF